MIISNFPGGGESKPVKKSFSECTWEEVSQICRAGYASEYWQIGDTKNMIDGDTASALRIIGFDHDYVSDIATYGREKAGITLQMEKLPQALYGPLNGTSYKNLSWYSETSGNHCAMHSTNLPNYLSSMPDALKSVLVPVGKEFYYKEKKEIQTISDTLFLLSANEVFGTYTSGFGSEGEQYEYFAAGNSTKMYNTAGESAIWWTRSPYQETSGDFIIVNAPSGNTYCAASEQNRYGSPCMCI